MVSNNKVEQVVLHTIFILLCIIAAAPFLLLISSSITEESTLLQYGYSFFPKKSVSMHMNICSRAAEKLSVVLVFLFLLRSSERPALF